MVGVPWETSACPVRLGLAGWRCEAPRNRRGLRAHTSRSRLVHGPILSRRLFEHAHDAGIAERTLRRALWALGARTRKLRGGPCTPWVWEQLLFGKVAAHLHKRPPYRGCWWLPSLQMCRDCDASTYDVSGLCARCLQAHEDDRA